MIPAIIHKIPAKKLEVSNAITPTINKMIPAILDFLPINNVAIIARINNTIKPMMYHVPILDNIPYD